MTIRKGKTIIAGNIPAGYEIGDIGLSAIGIDESLNYRRYLNGQEILQSQFPEFTKKIKRRVELYPSLACSDYQYETCLLTSAHGQCGKFVIDDERGVIRLPKVVNVMGLSDMAEAGVTVGAGLPNIKGSFGSYQDSATSYGWTPNYAGATAGAFFVEQTAGQSNYASHSNQQAIGTYGFDASKSNPIYGNSETVQQEAIKYPYFIQVASSCETTVNLTRDIELNNPFSLFEYKFSEYAIDNISWLESKGQWNSNKVYVSAYEELLAIYNGKEREGVSVKKTTETYTDYDFVIDEAGNTFRLPLKVLGASSKAVVGNGMTLGLTNGTAEYGIGTLVNVGVVPSSNLGANVATSGNTVSGVSGEILGVISDPSKSGIETSTEGMKLYFYVGETVQDSNLINAGAVLEDVNTLKNTALTTSQITNCITEIPQRVKLELADGVLTLKAGSEVIMPNGFEEDGVTPKFDYIEINEDRTYEIKNSPALTSTYTVSYTPQHDRLNGGPLSVNVSGSNVTLSTTDYDLYYNTSENTYGCFLKGELVEYRSFPVGIIKIVNGVITSIDQIFNGMGYIGSIVWVDKGVKGLAPYGRNEDGTLSNIEYTTKVLTVKQITNQSSLFSINLDGTLREYYLPFVHETVIEPIVDTHCFWYNPDSNEWNYHTPDTKNWAKFKHIPMGTATLENGAIKTFDTKQPFRAINYSDSSVVSGWGMPSNKKVQLAVGALKSQYVAPANGYFRFVAAASKAGYLGIENVTKHSYTNGLARVSGAMSIWSTTIASKGDVVEIVGSSDMTFTNGSLMFIYAQGEL